MLAGQGVFFNSSSTLCLRGFHDSDLGACPDTRRSTTDICFFLGKSLISWKSKKQLIVSRSYLEVEYRALTHATCESIWILSLLDDFKVPHHITIIIYCDNKSALHITASLIFHENKTHRNLMSCGIRQGVT